MNLSLSDLVIVAVLALLPVSLAACHEVEGHEQRHEEHHQIVVTSPVAMDVIGAREYVCQIHSRRHIEVRALEEGYLEEIPVGEGQAVLQGQLMFKIVPVLFQAKLETEVAEAQQVQIEYDNTKKLNEKGVVSSQELALAQAKLTKAKAQVELARAELNFTEIKATYNGIIDRLHHQQGSLIEVGDTLTTLSDNDVMWVYFNVPEARYLEYQGGRKDDDLTIELRLANGAVFPQTGQINAVEADFNNETGNIAFRADFSNPEGLLRHGQTGTVLINRTLHDAVVIPQRATFEILDKRYVFVVGEDGIVHQREIQIEIEQDDIFVIAKGLAARDRIVIEGVRQVHDGEMIEHEFQDPAEVLSHLKHPAE